MAEQQSGEDLLRAEFHGQTARISWEDLQPHFARGSVVEVSAGLDIVEVAMQLKQDNTAAFQRWIDEGCVTGIQDEQASRYAETNPSFWAVVVPPWVLIQQA